MQTFFCSIILPVNLFLKQIFHEAALQNRPNEVAFLPKELLAEILINEFKSIEEKRDLDVALTSPEKNKDSDMTLTSPATKKDSQLMVFERGFSDNEADSDKEKDADETDFVRQPWTSSPSPQPSTSKACRAENHFNTRSSSKRAKMDSESSTTKDEWIYLAEPVKDKQMKLCRHGYVPLDAILKGEWKAVNFDAALRLLAEHHVKIEIVERHHNTDIEEDGNPRLSNGNIGPLLTA